MDSDKAGGLYANPGPEEISPEQPSTVPSIHPNLDAPGKNERPSEDREVFGDEEDAAIRYRTLSWPLVSVLMIAEIVSNGMLSLPSAFAVVGIVPGVIVTAFLGLSRVFLYRNVL